MKKNFLYLLAYLICFGLSVENVFAGNEQYLAHQQHKRRLKHGRKMALDDCAHHCRHTASACTACAPQCKDACQEVVKIAQECAKVCEESKQNTQTKQLEKCIEILNKCIDACKQLIECGQGTQAMQNCIDSCKDCIKACKHARYKIEDKMRRDHERLYCSICLSEETPVQRADIAQ